MDWETYKHRNTIDRCFNRLEHWRGLAMRTDLHAHDDEAGLMLGALVMWTPT